MPARKPKKPIRNRNYRVPFEIRGRARYFPTMPVLFQFIRRVLGDEFDTPEDLVPDSQVARFVYPGFPYAHQFKLGQKNISHIGHISFLCRHTGLPLSLVQKVRTGEWDLERAWKEYLSFKKRNKVRLTTELVGPRGKVEIDLESKVDNTTKAGKVYGFLVHRLRPIVCPPNRPEVL
jgi:hypothetical protein